MLLLLLLLLLLLGYIRVERLQPSPDADVFCWEGNLNTILGLGLGLGPSPLITTTYAHDVMKESPSNLPFVSHGVASHIKSSSSLLFDDPSTIVLPERVRVYVLIAQRGLGRCLQELQKQTKPPEMEINNIWQPIVLVETL